jgi:transcription initiation factor TFIIA small subunit
LTDTLDDLINEGRIEPQLAMKILSTFDRVITEVLADKVRTRLTFKVCFRPRRLGAWLSLTPLLDQGQMLRCSFTQGHLDTYRFCDEVWTFLIKDVNFKLDNQTTVTADKVKIVSCNSKRPGEA